MLVTSTCRHALDATLLAPSPLLCTDCATVLSWLVLAGLLTSSADQLRQAKAAPDACLADSPGF